MFRNKPSRAEPQPNHPPNQLTPSFLPNAYLGPAHRPAAQPEICADTAAVGVSGSRARAEGVVMDEWARLELTSPPSPSPNSPCQDPSHGPSSWPAQEEANHGSLTRF